MKKHQQLNNYILNSNNKGIEVGNFELTDTFPFQTFQMIPFRYGNIPCTVVHKDRRRIQKKTSPSVPMKQNINLEGFQEYWLGFHEY